MVKIMFEIQKINDHQNYRTTGHVNWQGTVVLSHGSNHDHEMTVVRSTAEQVRGDAGQVSLGEGAGREDVKYKASLQGERGPLMKAP